MRVPRTTARKAAIANGDLMYNTGRPCHKGHLDNRYTKTGHCVTCTLERSRSGEKVEYRKKYKAANYERILKVNRACIAKNREHYRAKAREYQHANADVQRPKNSAKTMFRIAAKIQRTPLWLSEDEYWMMEQAYDIARKRKEATGIAWDVDHIVPLRGKHVSGLHVPWNLQVIPASVNRSKGRKFMELHNEH